MILFDTNKSNVNADEGPVMIRAAVAMMCLSGFGVFLRFIALRLTRQTCCWDDWMILPALVFSWATAVTHIIAVLLGNFGRHEEFLTPQKLVSFFKCLYVVQILHSVSIGLIKFSILLFFRRIFRIPKTRIPVIVLAAVIAAWLVATILCCIFSCNPISGFWDKTLRSQCIDSIKFFVAVAVPNLGTDIVLFIFPIPLIWNLHIRLTQKIAILTLFALGGFIIVVSTLRLVSVVHALGDPDITYALLPLGIWNVVKSNVAIVLACLTSMGPLLRFLLGQKVKPASTVTGSNNYVGWDYSSHGRKSNLKDSISLTQLTESRITRQDPYAQHTSISAGRPNDGIKAQSREMSDTGIHVERDIEWAQYGCEARTVQREAG